MHIAILTKNLPPMRCGIGDHSVLFGNAMRSKGHRVTLVGGKGDSGEGSYIVENFWQRKSVKTIIEKIDSMGVDHLVLQYTPQTFAYAGGRYPNYGIEDFWSTCSRKWKTSLILHETYFRAWWHPPSLIRGTLERHLIKLMVRDSHYVFTASQLLFEEIERWGHVRACLLPIGSNLTLNVIDRAKMRKEKGVEPREVVLTIFGGAAGISKLTHYVEAVDSLLFKRGVPARWLFLGDIKKEMFSMKSPIMAPGFLEDNDLSAWLQLTDVFLMPHISGLSAKRGTLMAALQHGLPVVGTQGPMTDRFWKQVPGVKLTPISEAEKYADCVLRVACSEELRKNMSESNHIYFEKNMRWETISEKFIQCVTR